MYDLGRDVPLDQFIEKAKEVDADLICMSTLMTTTMGGMQTVIEKLKDQGIRDKFKVMVREEARFPKICRTISEQRDTL